MTNMRDDGSIESANSTNYDNMYQNDVDFDNGIYRCLVVERYFTDDRQNRTKDSQNPAVIYKCIIMGGFHEGKTIDNVKVASWLGGQFNYDERIFRPTTLTETQEIVAEETDGDVVYVTFVNGNTYDPIIIGCDTQPLDSDKTGATKEDGARSVREYNGIKTLIDKMGVWIRTRFGGKINPETNALEPDEEKMVKIEVQETWEDGKITVEVSDDSYIETIEGANAEGEPIQKTTRTYKEGLKIEEDAKNDKITRTFKDGMKIEEDGMNDKITVTTKGNVIATFDGQSGLVTIDVEGASILEINKDGTVTVTANTKINLLAPEVDVGDSAALSSTLFEKLKQEFDKHTHPFAYVAGIIPAQGTSNPPLVPLIDVVGSQTVKVND